MIIFRATTSILSYRGEGDFDPKAEVRGPCGREWGGVLVEGQPAPPTSWESGGAL